MVRRKAWFNNDTYTEARLSGLETGMTALVGPAGALWVDDGTGAQYVFTPGVSATNPPVNGGGSNSTAPPTVPTGPWTPSALASNIMYWLDADTLTGTTVTAWNDKLTTAPVATTTADSAPTVVSNSLNSHKSVHFNTNQHLAISAVSGGNPYSFFAVSRVGGSGHRLFTTDRSTGANEFISYWNGLKNDLNLGDENRGNYIFLWPSDAPQVTSQDGVWDLLSLVVNTSASDSYYGNKGIQITPSSITNFDATHASYDNIGFNFDAPNGDGSSDANAAEVLLFNSALSLSDRQKVEGYLAHKYGLALPAGHPYTTSAP